MKVEDKISLVFTVTILLLVLIPITFWSMMGFLKLEWNVYLWSNIERSIILFASFIADIITGLYALVIVEHLKEKYS